MWRELEGDQWKGEERTQRHKQAKSQEMQMDIHFRLNGEV